MPQIINTNVASLNTQRNLNSTQNQLNVALQRLSSGLRINSAKDDAAGLAIVERFTAQIRGLNQAARNANDGVSLSQTAEGDLAQITNNLQRLRELSVQSANATNSSSDRAALQLETNELIAEIDRVASTSAFNGVKLLDGNFASQQFQVGANAGETVNISSIGSARTSALGQALTASLTATGPVAADLTAGQLTVNSIDVGVVARDAALIATAITNTGTNVTATATNAQTAITFNDVVGSAGTVATAGSYTFAAATTIFDYTADSASFDVDGNTVTLNGSYTDAAGVAAKIGTDLGASYTVAASGSDVISITKVATGVASTAPVISAFDGNVDGGVATIADFTAGTATVGATTDVSSFTATADVPASFDFSGDSVSFDVVIGGALSTQTTITLNTDLTDQTGFLSEINTQLAAGTTTLTATVAASKLVFTTAGNTDDPISIANYNGNVDGGIATLADFTAAGTSVAGLAAVTSTTNYSLSLDGTDLDLTTVGANDTVTGAEIATLISGLTGYTASYSGTSLSIDKADGSNIVLIESGTQSGVAEGLVGDGIATAVTETYYGTVSVTSTDADLVIGGTASANVGAGFAPTTVTAALGGVTIANTNISTVAGANAAIASIDSALTTINSSRASLGAIQNRFSSIVSSIQTSAENLSSARSRIRDADFAQETAELTRAQILQQAGVSILSQANSLPQLALSLLQ